MGGGGGGGDCRVSDAEPGGDVLQDPQERLDVPDVNGDGGRRSDEIGGVRMLRVEAATRRLVSKKI